MFFLFKSKEIRTVGSVVKKCQLAFYNFDAVFHADPSRRENDGSEIHAFDERVHEHAVLAYELGPLCVIEAVFLVYRDCRRHPRVDHHAHLALVQIPNRFFDHVR